MGVARGIETLYNQRGLSNTDWNYCLGPMPLEPPPPGVPPGPMEGAGGNQYVVSFIFFFQLMTTQSSPTLFLFLKLQQHWQ